MSPEQLITLSNFLNAQANLPVAIQEIAESIKASLEQPAEEPSLVDKVMSAFSTESNG